MDRSLVATFLMERCARLYAKEERTPWWALHERWAIHKRQREALEALLDFYREYGLTEAPSGAEDGVPERPESEAALTPGAWHADGAGA